MGSAKQQTAVSKVMNLLHEWDKGSRSVRHKILVNFIEHNRNKTGPELDSEFAEAASLFLARLTAWLRLTYMIGTSLTQQLQAITIFVSSSSGHKFLSEFLEVGGVLTLLEILGLKQSKEVDKTQAILLLQCVANSGRKYKELICESYGIRAVAECLAKSKSDQTQDTAKNLLLSLAEGNPRFCQQVYKGLIALLPCSSPKAQQMAAQCLLRVQPMVENAHPSIVEPLLTITRTLHLEVQYEAIQLILLLMNYSVRDKLLEGLIRSLKPSKEEILTGKQPEILNDQQKSSLLTPPLPVYVQQAASAKCILSLCQNSLELAERLIQMRVVHHLMYAMGNQDYADSQRQASLALEFLCRTFPIVDDHVREAVTESFYVNFMADPESLYVNMTAIQADILLSNKVNIPGARRRTRTRIYHTRRRTQTRIYHGDVLRLESTTPDGQIQWKLFVGGLSWHTTDFTLRKYFMKYGNVTHSAIMYNPKTLKPRGFGFVSYESEADAESVLSQSHTVDGKEIMRKQTEASNCRKIFVGGVPIEASEAQLHSVFEKHFGPVEEVVIMCNPVTMVSGRKTRSRGFGFITFDEEETARQAVDQHYIFLMGKQVEIKAAEPRNPCDALYTDEERAEAFRAECENLGVAQDYWWFSGRYSLTTYQQYELMMMQLQQSGYGSLYTTPNVSPRPSPAVSPHTNQGMSSQHLLPTLPPDAFMGSFGSIPVYPQAVSTVYPQTISPTPAQYFQTVSTRSAQYSQTPSDQYLKLASVMPAAYPQPQCSQYSLFPQQQYYSYLADYINQPFPSIPTTSLQTIDGSVPVLISPVGRYM